MDKQALKDRQQEIIDLAGGFCAKRLDEEYFDLCERLVRKLGRKRNPPFATGRPEVWAAGIIHALGTINFLFDRSFEPYASANDISTHFGAGQSTVGNKSKQIRDMFKLHHYDKEFSTKAMRDSHPLANLVMVDGLIVPLSVLPEKHQDAVKKARAMGFEITFGTR